MLRLRSTAGPAVGCNYVPSHMFWQGIDAIAAIRVLANAIFHVHAKNTQMYPQNLPWTGVLEMKLYTDERKRAWISGPTGTERSGGASSSPGSACLGTTTCFD